MGTPGTAGHRGRSAAAPGRGSARAPRPPVRSRNRAWIAPSRRAPARRGTRRPRRPRTARGGRPQRRRARHPRSAVRPGRRAVAAPPAGWWCWVRSRRPSRSTCPYPGMPLALDLDTYAEQAEQFVGSMDREYYLHFAGHKPEFEIEPIYERHAGLFGRAVVDELRGRLAAAAPGDQARRARYLLELAVGGLLGNQTKEEETALAEREAALEIEVAGERLPYRQSAVAQANEPDAGRRAEIEQARLAVLERELNPLHLQTLERAHALAKELGWPSYREMYKELKQIDLDALEEQTSGFLDDTAGRYQPSVEPHIRAQVGAGFGDLRRSDLPHFFRAPGFD